MVEDIGTSHPVTEHRPVLADIGVLDPMNDPDDEVGGENSSSEFKGSKNPFIHDAPRCRRKRTETVNR
jgi:hypothetical protein